MDELIKSNKGFESRINFYIDFPDYSADELYTIIEQMVEKEHYILEGSCKKVMLDFFNNEIQCHQDNFSNARLGRNLFEKSKLEQATRVTNAQTKEVDVIISEDITRAIDKVKTKTNKKLIGFTA